MSKEDKLRHSARRYKDETATKKQVKIAKSNGYTSYDEEIKQPHRLNKHHVMNCGQPGCVLCGNPRKLFKELTAQEKRFYQDVDSVRDKHSNGLLPPEE